MKNYKIIYWVTTTLIFLFEGVIPALTSQSELAKEGIRHLGYPEYFGIALMVYKVVGATALILPQTPAWLKEWAYAGFVLELIFATISHLVVDGIKPQSFFPILVLAVVLISYFAYHKLNNLRTV